MGYLSDLFDDVHSKYLTYFVCVCLLASALAPALLLAQVSLPLLRHRRLTQARVSYFYLLIINLFLRWREPLREMGNRLRLKHIYVCP